MKRSPELGIRATKTRLGTVYRIVIDDHVIVTTGERCYVSSDARTFHRRTLPRSGGLWYGIIAIDHVLYASAVAISRDYAETWQQAAIPLATRHVIFRDAAGTWWFGGEGNVLRSKHPDRGWKEAFVTPGDKVLALRELDGALYVVGTGSGVWDGKKFRPAKDLAGETITRLVETPSGALVCHGDGGCAFRSTDRGKTWRRVTTRTREDLEDSAWVAGALYVVGGGGVMLRSTDEGKSFERVDSGTTSKLWVITSWGDGALFSGADGVIRVLAAPNERYWKGAEDRFAGPPIAVDTRFHPPAAIPAATRARTHDTLYAAVVAEHRRSSAKLRTAHVDPNPTLAAAIDAGDDDALAVYADWLSDCGDVRGELAQVQLRRAADPRNKKLAHAERALLVAHADALLGRLVGLDDVLTLEWRAGFIHRARVASSDERNGATRPELDIAQVVSWLLAEPSARFLRELVVGIVTYVDNDYGGVARVIGQARRPALRSIVLGDFDPEESELSWSTLGKLAPIYPAVPNLRRLRIRSGSMTLGAIALPELETLEVITGGLDRKSAKAIVTAPWPKLRTLELQLGSPHYGAEADIEDLQPILDAAGFPRLERLALSNNQITERLVTALASSRILPQLRELSLAGGTLGDAGAATLFRLQKAFAHLTTIDLEDNYLTTEGKRLLAKTSLAVSVGTQRDDDGDPDRRYCAVGE